MSIVKYQDYLTIMIFL